MNSREKVRMIFTRRGGGEGALWMGNPHDETVKIYAEAWGVEPTREALANHLNDDCRWFIADGCYNHPDGIPALDPSYGTKRDTLSAGGCFAGAETVNDIEAYPWPDVKYLDFGPVYESIKKFPDKMIFTGMWCPFFHNLADFFGMENYFVNMHERPAVVEAATERVADYYIAANEKFFSGLGGVGADVMFFGNDFGTQLDLFLSPEMFEKFILPSFKKIIAVGKKYDKIVMLHSCGSIYRIIPDLIDAGVDALHPIQAKAAGMDAKSLAQYKDHLAFLGGIDAQSFFVNASPAQIKAEVRRVRSELGPNIVVSPSHEMILPNVPAANILAMAEAALE